MIPSALLEVRAAHGGRGVFALEKISRNKRIMPFIGPAYDRAAIMQLAANGHHDLYLQIALNEFIGPSGFLDDLVNHACEPNCYIHLGPRGIWLKAIRAIRPGEELSFDYGATQQAFPFRFRCTCGADECRGEIGNFDEIPPARTARYLKRGIFPHYIVALMRESGLREQTVA